LLRWYVLHVLMLPFVIVIFMAIHFWRVRKDGGISGRCDRRLEEGRAMTEIPEHLRKRAEAARAKAEAEKGEAAAGRRHPRGDETPGRPGESRIPAHLLERSRAAKAKAEGGEAAEAGGGGVAVAERPSAVTAVGPGGGRWRARRRPGRWATPSGSSPSCSPARSRTSRPLPSTRCTPGPTCLAAEFVASLVCLAFTFVFSVFVNAPLLQLANPNRNAEPVRRPRGTSSACRSS
jgi:hypothetical protein